MKNKILLEFEDVLETYKSKEHGMKAFEKYMNWFPLEASPKLAGIVADIMGDGHLQNEPKLRIDYTSKSTDELKRFNKEIFTLFHIKGKVRRCTTNKYETYNLGINNKPLGRTLKLIGVPAGAKVLKDFKIPKWILKDKLLFSRFMNRLFSCEGCVDVSSKCIEINMYKSLSLIEEGIIFFEDIKFYLDEYYKVKTTNPFLTGRTNIRKDGIKTKGIRLKIKNKKSLENFRKHISFDNKEKLERLNKILL